MAVLVMVGCDKSGKTALRYEIHKLTNRHVIIDRFLPCQVVYGEYYKKGHPALHDMRELEKHLTNSPVPWVYVFTTADPEVIKKRFKEHKENSIDVQDIAAVQDSYRHYLSNTEMDVFEIDTSKENLRASALRVLDYADNVDRIWTL